jgi:hypothetical protein
LLVVFPNHFSQNYLFPPQIYLQAMYDLHPHVFKKKVVIPLDLKYEIIPFLNLVFVVKRTYFLWQITWGTLPYTCVLA